MFLTKQDLTSKLRESDLLRITGGDDMVVEHALSYAVGIMRSYLAERYDVESIFSAVGEDREGALVAMGVDIAVYEIVAIAQPNIDLTDRRERRRQAIEYLTAVRDDNLPTGWPLRPVEPDEGEEEDGISGSGSVLWGGIPSRGNYF